MKRFAALLILFLLITLGEKGQACTLWAANGFAVEDGGSLIIKNRDWAPEKQVVQLIAPSDGYRYIGLFTKTGHTPGLKAGINEKGLVVINASASSIPRAERDKLPHRPILRYILNKYDSVDEVLAQTDLFLGPEFLMIADSQKIAVIEVGLDGKYSVEVRTNGSIYHTNHYVQSGMEDYNELIGASSKQRYQRIGELFDQTPSPYTLETFLNFSSDQNDGPDNSVFRTGSDPQKERTVAVWAVSLPVNQSPHLYIKLLNPNEDEQIIQVNTDKIFNGSIQLPATF